MEEQVFVKLCESWLEGRYQKIKLERIGRREISLSLRVSVTDVHSCTAIDVNLHYSVHPLWII